MSTFKVPIAIIGAGYAANYIHIPSWRNVKDANIVAVCDVNREQAVKTAKKWSIPHFYTDFDKLLEEEKDAVIDIVTPPTTHMPLSIKAMKAGHSVVLEKPMATSMEECDKILNEYEQRKDKIKLLIVHNYLFSPSMIKLKSIIKMLRLDILNVNISMLHTPEDWMIRNKNHWCHSIPGGRLGECLIHPIYILQDLIGRLKVEKVNIRKRGTYSWVKYDELHATFTSAKSFGSIYISFNAPRQTSLPSIKIYGKDAIIDFDGTNTTLNVQKGMAIGSNMGKLKDGLYMSMQDFTSVMSNAFKVLTKQWKTSHTILFDAFLKALKGKKIPYTPEEAYEATRTYLEVVSKID